MRANLAVDRVEEPCRVSVWILQLLDHEKAPESLAPIAATQKWRRVQDVQLDIEIGESVYSMIFNGDGAGQDNQPDVLVGHLPNRATSDTPRAVCGTRAPAVSCPNTRTTFGCEPLIGAHM